MKFRKLFLLVIFVSISSLVFADGFTPGNGYAPGDGEGWDEDTTPDTSCPECPIDTNKSVLVITAVLIAAGIGYKKLSLKKA